MKDFRTMKAELQSCRKNIRYFTKAFYETYCNAVKRMRWNAKNGINDEVLYTLQDGNQCRGSREFIPVFETDFYNKNGAAYCEFLELMYKYEREDEGV